MSLTQQKMSPSKTLTLRVQSAEGTSRVEIADNEVTARLYEIIHDALNLTSFAFTLHKDRQKKEEILSSKSRSLKEYKLQHGDMIHLSPVNGAVIFDKTEEAKPRQDAAEAGPSTSSMVPRLAVVPSTTLPEDSVDLELYKTDGRIQRQRDEKLCRHKSNGSCVHCTPLEPWDETYLKDHNIKHLSFHSYLRKMTQHSKFVSLDEISLKIKPGCKEHPAWPRGICSKCQPSTLVLNRQVYRHVDNVLIEQASLVDRFISYWRQTSHQRLGILYGKYERHPDVPLGLRARVSHIYEPAQLSNRDTIQLTEDHMRPTVDEIAARLGLKPVGWIFTDLLPDENEQGKVKHLRGMDSHFLSSYECMMAGHFQNEFPNVCRYSPTGHYGSKFVTVCVTGSADKQIQLEGYQVSGQCQALVRDQVLVPCKDAPDLGYIKESSDQQYVPTVYYKERDSYGNEVGVSAGRVPVAYLLVDVPCGVRGGAGGVAVGGAGGGATYSATHRPHSPQTLAGLQQHINRASSFLEAVSDLHVLAFLATEPTLPLGIEGISPLIEAVRNRDTEAAELWRTQLGPTLDAASLWTCPHCTYHNSHSTDVCDMCALPRGNAM